MQSIYQRVTQTIVRQLEQGVAPWVRPWRSVADPVPRNLASQRPYRGINAVVLQLLAQQTGYTSNQWVTFHQAMALGARVQRGAHGAQIVFYQFHDQPRPDSDSYEPTVQKQQARPAPLVRVYTVFNVAQVEGLAVEQPAPMHEFAPEPEVEHLLQSSGATISHGGNHAFYRCSSDDIQLPLAIAFNDTASYYATALHELVHWTGHPSRCARDFGQRFGDQAYAAEELVAELGSAFLSAHCRLDGQLQHAEYIGHWLELLTSDPRAVFVAAAKAQHAADFILSRAYAAEPAAQAA